MKKKASPELKTARQSAHAAIGRLAVEKGGIGKLYRKLDRTPDYSYDDFEADRALLALQNIRDPWVLKEANILKPILRALEEGDFRFFIRLGKVLGTPPKPLDEVEGRVSRLEWFLIEHWGKTINGVPELCTLGAPALTQVCRTYLKNESLTQDAVTKTRQRLGLIPCRTG